MRFLSHAETMNVFQRGCVRAGVKVQYSQGFNPRLRLSLPLPRSVGVESDDELLALRVAEAGFDAEEFKEKLSAQLPVGFELLWVNAAKGKKTYQASGVTYELAIKREYSAEKLKANIESLLTSEKIEIERRIDARGRTKIVDVRGFIESIEFDDSRNVVTVECGVSPAGAIRVDEILKALGLDTQDLAAPIRRRKVQWQNN